MAARRPRKNAAGEPVSSDAVEELREDELEKRDATDATETPVVPEDVQPKEPGEDDRFHKTYVVAGVDDYESATAQIHADNSIGVLNEAIIKGLHPKGEPTFDGFRIQPDGISIELDYSVEVEPAVTDALPQTTETPYGELAGRFDGDTLNGFPEGDSAK